MLDAAMGCFWQDGYEATSVRDLAARMGITSTSLYNAFGDKRSLFRKVLERYAECSTRARIARLESTLAPKQAVRAFLTEIVERSLDDRDRRGCLLVNSALEVAPHDPELGAAVADRLGEIEAFFRRSISAALTNRRVSTGTTKSRSHEGSRRRTANGSANPIADRRFVDPFDPVTRVASRRPSNRPSVALECRTLMVS